MDLEQHLDRSADRAIAAFREARKRLGQVDSTKKAIEVLENNLKSNEHTFHHRAAFFFLEKLKLGDFAPGRCSDGHIIRLIDRYVRPGPDSYALLERELHLHIGK